MLYTVKVDGQINQHCRSFYMRALDKLRSDFSTPPPKSNATKTEVMLENFEYYADDDDTSDYSISSLDEILEYHDVSMETLDMQEMSFSGSTVVMYKSE